MEDRAPHSVAGISLKDGKYFIAKRIAGGSLGGKWEFPGGKLEPGEDCLAALKREYREEFGIDIRALLKICDVTFKNGVRLYYLSAYFIELLSEDFSLSEHTEWRWATLDEILALDFADSDRKILPFLI